VLWIPVLHDLAEVSSVLPSPPIRACGALAVVAMTASEDDLHRPAGLPALQVDALGVHAPLADVEDPVLR